MPMIVRDAIFFHFHCLNPIFAMGFERPFITRSTREMFRPRRERHEAFGEKGIDGRFLLAAELVALRFNRRRDILKSVDTFPTCPGCRKA